MSVQTTTFNVKGMTCNHCVKSIENALGELKGIETVEVDLKKNTVTASFNEASVGVDKVKEVIEEAGYDVVS